MVIHNISTYIDSLNKFRNVLTNDTESLDAYVANKL
jgi:hypothetical protein